MLDQISRTDKRIYKFRNPKTGWPPERLEHLRQLMAKGHTASQAAGPLGCSRNSVIGAARRAGFMWQNSAGDSAEHRRARRAGLIAKRIFKTKSLNDFLKQAERTARKTEPKPRKPKPLPVMPTALSIPLLALTSSMCRWPVADDPSVIGGFRFCGCQQAHGSSYCAAHARMSVDRSTNTQPSQAEGKAA